jgi:hypothetical protein
MLARFASSSVVCKHSLSQLIIFFARGRARVRCNANGNVSVLVFI